MRSMIFIAVLMVILPVCIGYSISYRRMAPRCRTICFQSGFKRVNEAPQTFTSKKEIKIKNDKLNEPCGCRSTKSYKDCCHVTHHQEDKSKLTPGTILRGRYTGYMYGVADFIIDTSHVTSEDYVKYYEESQASLKSGRKRWAKEINQMSKDIEFLYFDIIKETYSNENRQCNIVFRAIFKDENGELVGVEEETIFLQTGSVWQYTDSPSLNPLEPDFVTKIVTEIVGKEVEVSNRSNANGNNSGNNNKYIAPVRTDNGRIGMFDKSRINYIPKGTSSS